MIKPIGDHIIVQSITEGETTESGIIIPETAHKNAPQMGEVLAIGDTVKGVKNGDKIVFKKYAPDEVTIDGDVFLIIKQEDVVGIYG